MVLNIFTVSKVGRQEQCCMPAESCIRAAFRVPKKSPFPALWAAEVIRAEANFANAVMAKEPLSQHTASSAAWDSERAKQVMFTFSVCVHLRTGL